MVALDDALVAKQAEAELRIMPAGRSSFPAPDRDSLTLNVSGGLTFEVPALAGAASIVGDADAFGPNPRRHQRCTWGAGGQTGACR